MKDNGKRRKTREINSENKNSNHRTVRKVVGFRNKIWATGLLLGGLALIGGCGKVQQSDEEEETKKAICRQTLQLYLFL